MLKGVLTLKMLIDCDTAKNYRLKVAEILQKYYAGDEDLVDEIRKNAQSHDPVCKMAREAEEAEKAAKGIVDQSKILLVDREESKNLKDFASSLTVISKIEPVKLESVLDIQARYRKRKFDEEVELKVKLNQEDLDYKERMITLNQKVTDLDRQNRIEDAKAKATIKHIEADAVINTTTTPPRRLMTMKEMIKRENIITEGISKDALNNILRKMGKILSALAHPEKIIEDGLAVNQYDISDPDLVRNTFNQTKPLYVPRPVNNISRYFPHTNNENQQTPAHRPPLGARL
jgi:hypothetical protein